VKDGALIFQGGQPASELWRFANFDDGSFVIYGLQFRKRSAVHVLDRPDTGPESIFH
jgi:hypothetical protein